jgi:cysteinyl-tRNA synthetase
MSMKYLGEEIDIHTGGIDHVRVHHTNEIAQSEGATGKKFVRYWFHSHFMNIDGQKMSKSLGNLYTLDDLVSYGFTPLALRYFCLGSSYRKATNFTWEALAAAQTALSRLWEKTAGLPSGNGKAIQEYMEPFEEALADDLNTARALAVTLEAANSRDPDPDLRATISAMDRVLGLDLTSAEKRLEEVKRIQTSSSENERKALSLARQRDALRKEKKYQDADGLRSEILALGFIIEDTPQGPRLKPRGPKVQY